MKYVLLSIVALSALITSCSETLPSSTPTPCPPWGYGNVECGSATPEPEPSPSVEPPSGPKLPFPRNRAGIRG